ncbi:MAG TPA: extracellular solute-binding protein [Pseudobacteroides sp.]|uniref:extracellular solute-binding protein n=1 Tax=Pseudobacteroides sp. TaxID=1968840 RepID=UPI002F93E3E7
MSKSITRILLIVNLIVLILSLTSCKINILKDTTDEIKDKPEPCTLRLWNQWVDRSDLVSNPLKNAIREWNEKNPEVQVHEISWNGEQYKSKIKTALAAGDAPDLFYMWSGSFVGPFIDEGNILPLDTYLDNETLDKLMPGVIDSCKYNGKIYSLPAYRFVASLYCNTELFQKAGAKIPQTYDELLGSVKKLRSKGIVPIVVGEKDRWPGMYWYDILAMRQAGSTACRNALAIPALFDRQDYKEAADKLIQLVDNKAFNEDALNTSFTDMVNEFTEGNAAMMYQGNWVGTKIEDANSKVKEKVIAIPFPTIQNGKGDLTEFYGGITDGYFININTKHKQEAVNVLKYISEKSGKEGNSSGAGLSCWKLDDYDKSELSPLIKQTTQIMESGTSFISWWDTILPAADAETHKDLVAELFDRRLSSEEFVRRMAKLRGKY